jgi:hypothetical protein
MIKLFTARIGQSALVDAVQIEGGYGYSEEMPITRFYRDVKGAAIIDNYVASPETIIANYVFERKNIDLGIGSKDVVPTEAGGAVNNYVRKRKKVIFQAPSQVDNVASLVTSLAQAVTGKVLMAERQNEEFLLARAIICIGRGLRKKDDLVMVYKLAEILRAEVACTKSLATDNKWLPADRYIGISGQTVKPDSYIGLGVSGQGAHVAGMRESQVIVAIDTNEKAPIFEIADYGIIGDIYEVVPLLIAALQKYLGQHTGKV